MKNKIALTYGSIGMIMMVPSLAQAQQAGAEEPVSPAGIPEIVVTAQKRSESIQKVPATITALNSEALETRQINDTAALQSQVPGLVVGETFGASLISLRGISTGVTSGAEDPSVATHINGVYQPRSRTIDSALVDLDRVEVLSGPQGTLYGRNATAGVINYILKRPSSSFQGEVTGSVGNYETFGVKGRVSGPLSDNVRLLASGVFENRDKGFTKNLLAGAPQSRLQTNRVAGGRAALDIDLPGGAGIELDAIYLDSKYTPTTLAFGPSQESFIQAALDPQSFNPREVYTNYRSLDRTKYLQLIGTINVPLSDGVSLKSITGYQRFRNHLRLDGDASRTRVVESDIRFRSNTFSQELNLNASLLDGRLKSIFGAFYYNDKFNHKGDNPFDLSSFFPTAAPFIFSVEGPIHGESYSAFTDHTFSVTDRLRLQAGIRYNHDKKSAATNILFDGFDVCPAPPATKSWNSWTPRFGAQYDITDSSMLYAQYTKGFKTGGFAASSCMDEFDPEKISGVEVGLKARFFDNRVRFNIAGYSYRIKDLQVQKVVDIGTLLIENAARAKVYGVEASLTAQLAEHLRLDASGMIQSAKYDEFFNCNEKLFLGACSASDTSPDSDASGNRLNRAPPYTANVGAEYDVMLNGGGKILLRGESVFSGRVDYHEFPTEGSQQKAYSIQNAFISYTSPNDRYVLRGFIKNIANKVYKSGYLFFSATRQDTGQYAPPRTFGAEATVRF
ncbi:TonB-dependent receptor [Rhizorhapis suberifaciens]|uniref:Iron complex outermembrane receptor protein n=1 Tax=Rhizorhapis suberifaciens TaxID=13656 RepID=A0A840HW77_9SPHN|nr:TonB-dependent receptor [Rhizorhapis suberifaciens]MBB4642213.1 iron complex outermembrane receptor protein [Rhizorhapis suberifaciens]